MYTISRSNYHVLPTKTSSLSYEIIQFSFCPILLAYTLPCLYLWVCHVTELLAWKFMWYIYNRQRILMPVHMLMLPYALRSILCRFCFVWTDTVLHWRTIWNQIVRSSLHLKSWTSHLHQSCGFSTVLRLIHQCSWQIEIHVKRPLYRNF